MKIEPFKIRNVGIIVYDLFPGKFRLEIDYIGFISDLKHDDNTEYEGYYIESSPFNSPGSF